MHYNGIVRPDQLAMMSKVLDDHCRDHGIRSGTSAHESTASMIVALYRHGYQTADDIKDALDSDWVGRLSHRAA